MGRLAPGARDGLAQEIGIGFFQPERVRAANRHETLRQPECIEQPHRQPFQLVGADRQAAAAGAEFIECGFETWERTGTIGDMRGVMGDELLDQPIHFRRGELAAFGFQRALNQRSGAATHQVARDVVGDRRQTFGGQDGIERANEIGRAVDQRAVEVEDHRWSPHHPVRASGGLAQ